MKTTTKKERAMSDTPNQPKTDWLDNFVKDDLTFLTDGEKQAIRTQLKERLLEHKKTYITELRWKYSRAEEAVPISALTQVLGEDV